jgi:hypothetical protein
VAGVILLGANIKHAASQGKANHNDAEVKNGAAEHGIHYKWFDERRNSG